MCSVFSGLGVQAFWIFGSDGLRQEFAGYGLSISHEDPQAFRVFRLGAAGFSIYRP